MDCSTKRYRPLKVDIKEKDDFHHHFKNDYSLTLKPTCTCILAVDVIISESEIIPITALSISNTSCTDAM